MHLGKCLVRKEKGGKIGKQHCETMKDLFNKVKIKYSKTQQSSRNGEGDVYKTETQGFSADRGHLGGYWSKRGHSCTLLQRLPLYLCARNGLCTSAVFK